MSLKEERERVWQMGKIERKCHTSLHSFRISFKRHWGSSNRFSKRHLLKHLERLFVRPLWGCSDFTNQISTKYSLCSQLALVMMNNLCNRCLVCFISTQNLVKSWIFEHAKKCKYTCSISFPFCLSSSVLLFLKVFLSFYIRFLLLFSLSASFPWRDWFLLHLPLWSVFLSYQIRPLPINFFSHCVNIHWALCFFKCHGWSLPIGWSMNISSGLTPVRFCVRWSERTRTFARVKARRRARDEKLSIHTF